MPTFIARSGSINSLKVTGSLSVSGSVFLESLSPSSSANIVTYDPTTKQLFYSSSAKSAVSSSFMSTLTTNNNQSYYVTFVNNQANQYQQLYIDSNPGITYNPYTNILRVTSSYAFTSSVAVSSSYADTASYTVSSSYADSASHSNTLIASLRNDLGTSAAEVWGLDSDGNLLSLITVDGVNNANTAGTAGQLNMYNASPGTYYPTLAYIGAQSQIYETSSFSYDTTTGLLTATSSWAQSASYADNSISASYALSSSWTFPYLNIYNNSTLYSGSNKIYFSGSNFVSSTLNSNPIIKFKPNDGNGGGVGYLQYAGTDDNFIGDSNLKWSQANKSLTTSGLSVNVSTTKILTNEQCVVLVSSDIDIVAGLELGKIFMIRNMVPAPWYITVGAGGSIDGQNPYLLNNNVGIIIVHTGANTYSIVAKF